MSPCVGGQQIQDITLYDKYARWLPLLRRRETWPEVIDRVVTFLRTTLASQGRTIEPLLWDQLRQAMLHKEVLPSMRVVQMAGPALERCHVGAYNCLAGDEQFVTRQGLKSFVETVGTTQDVLCVDGQWRPATVSQFGEAPVQVITLRPGARSRTSLRRVVRATADHGWVTTRGHVRNLQVGDDVLANAVQPTDEINDHEFVRGFLFGDGTVQDNCARVRLCGKKALWLPVFERTDARVSYPLSADGDPMVSWSVGAFASCKELPEQPTPSWMLGYMAADGYDSDAQPQLTTVRQDVVTYLQNHAAELGIVVTGLTVWTTDSNFGSRQPLYRMTIRPAADVTWKVLSIEPTDEVVPVYCVTEPETHTFTLAGGLSSMNCAYLELDGPAALGELLYILMQGTGVGYSVERRAVGQWATVAPQEGGEAPIKTIPDSTDGWCQALVKTILYAMYGIKAQWDYSAIRPEGTWLHTKGGRASGPEPLKRLLDTVHTVVRGAAGRQLTPFEVHRLATLCGSIVQVGGVRRAAEIALFDADDAEMAGCKDGEFWQTYPELAMANNSAVFTGPVTPEFVQEFVALLAARGTGEPGIFRRDGQVPMRRQPADFGTNPCGEIILRSRQFCNLSVAVARPTDTVETLRRKVRLAALLGTIQSCLTTFRYLPETWRRNCEEERLLGVDITGALDCPVLQPSPMLPSILRDLRRSAVEANVESAEMLGVPRSAAVTCNKPSGNSSQLLQAASGIHPRYAPYYVRRLRIGARTPLGERLRSLGIPVYPEVGQGTLEQARVWVFELPVKSPAGAVTRHDLTAREQLDYWLQWKQHWTEHNPSCTIYVGPTEWGAVANFLTEQWEQIGGLSFLPKDGGVYALAPYEEIDVTEYEQRVQALPSSLSLDTLYESVDTTTLAQDYACVGGICEI